MSSDPGFKTEVFRNDFGKQVIAKNRHMCSIGPVKLATNASGYVRGTVLAKNSVSGEFAAYNDGASSGLPTAVCVLLDLVRAEESTSNNVLADAVFGGELFYDNLTTMDAAAVTDLNGRTFTDSLGNKILRF